MSKNQSLRTASDLTLWQLPLELCLMQRHDGISVREIMNNANRELGLFYYYFKNKYDVFDNVLDRFFAHYDTCFCR